MDLTVDTAFSLFKILDTKDEGVLELDAFVTGCLRLRGSAKGIEIALSQMECRWAMQKLIHQAKDIRGQVDSLHDKLTEQCMLGRSSIASHGPASVSANALQRGTGSIGGRTEHPSKLAL